MLQQAARRDAGLKLLALAREATLAAEAILRDATRPCAQRVRVETHTVERLFDREQRATHGLAWLATYVEGIRQVTAFAERAHHAGALGEIEELMVQIGIGEFLAADPGRHSDEPGRDRAPRRSRTDAQPRWRRASPGPLEGLIAAGNDAAPRAAGDPAARAQRPHRRRLPAPTKSLAVDPRRDAQVRRKRGDAAGAWLASRQPSRSRSTSSRRCRSSACSASPSRRTMAAWDWARRRCASSPRNCRAAISASARSARARRSPPS